jgi:hypothetical protein
VFEIESDFGGDIDVHTPDLVDRGLRCRSALCR